MFRHRYPIMPAAIMRGIVGIALLSALAVPLHAADREVPGDYYDWTKSMKPERPYIHDYSQTLVVKIFLAEKAPEDGSKVFLTFGQALEVIRKLDNLTCGIPKIAYLVGWQFNGHDSKYPSWAEVNPRLKRAQDATARDSLCWLMDEASKYHTTVSLHINMFDAFEDSPLWKEYLEKDVIAKDVSGQPIKGEVFGDSPRMDTQSYQISYAREWELGLAQKRIDDLLAMLPIQKAGTIQIDAFHSMRPVPHAYPQEKHPELSKDDKRISPYLDYSLEREVATQRKIHRYFRDRGVDVTSEGSAYALRPDAFIGLQPMAWHYNEPAPGIPADLYCGTPMHAEPEIKKDPENLSGLLEQFCTRVVPWYCENNKTENRDVPIMRKGGDWCMPLLWKEEKALLAYSPNGCNGKTWQLPPGWKNVHRLALSRITVDGPQDTGSVEVKDLHFRLTLEKGEAVMMIPK